MQRYLKLVTPAAALAGGYFAGYATAPKVQEATGALDIAPPELELRTGDVYVLVAGGMMCAVVLSWLLRSSVVAALAITWPLPALAL